MRYTCRLATGEPKPASDPSLGCEHESLGIAAAHAWQRNMEAADPSGMRTYAGRVNGTPYDIDEIPQHVRDKVDTALLRVAEGQKPPPGIAAVLVALGLIRWEPESASTLN